MAYSDYLYVLVNNEYHRIPADDLLRVLLSGQLPDGTEIDGIKVTGIAPGTDATSLGKAEDAAHASGHTGVMLLAVRKDTAAVLADTDGDYIPLIVDSAGKLHVVGPLTDTQLRASAVGVSGPLTNTELRASAFATTAQLNAYRSSDATYQPARLDKATNTIQTIDYSHHEIHAGSHFFVTDYQTINSGNSVDWLITTPNTTAWAHLTFEVQGSAITTVVLSEASDRSGSTGLTVINNDRNSATAATMTVHRGVTGGSTDGTAIWQSSGGAAAAQYRGGADNRQETEIILKQGTKYNLKVTSGTNSNIVAVKLRWYEHTNIV